LARLALAIGAVVLVAGGVAVLLWLLAPAAAPVAPRNPFGVGLREAAPGVGGLGGYILAVQGQFYRSLQGAVTALKTDGLALWSLIAIGFAYGAFHAAGPGHGKAIIAAYLVSSERALAKGLAMSLAAALVQALVAIGLVGVVDALFHATAASMGRVANAVEIISFAAVALLGTVLVWRKAGKLLAAAYAHEPAPHSHAHDHAHSHERSSHHAHTHAHDHAHAHVCDHGCGHAHLPSPQELEGIGGWREAAGVVLAAGIRPCSGAIILLVFALSQGLLAAGVAATFAMALGTALTTGLIAALAVFARTLATRIARGRGGYSALLIGGLELAAAAFVLVLGVSLLAGLWTSGIAS
jgi:ABC-type nickel/cobalt efflux system permease component RcnA